MLPNANEPKLPMNSADGLVRDAHLDDGAAGWAAYPSDRGPLGTTSASAVRLFSLKT
jgi:hypothetical protein